MTSSSRTRRVVRLSLGALICGMVPLGCGSTSESAPAAAGASVAVTNFQFTPAQVTVKAGDAVTWQFSQGIHNVVSGAGCASDGKFTSGDPKNASYMYSYTFKTPGTYEYYCTPHCQSMGMKGTVVVE